MSAEFAVFNNSDTVDFPSPYFSEAQLETETLAITVTGEYRLAGEGRSELWAVAGARYWEVDADLHLSAGLLPARSEGSTDHWYDPLLGLRGTTGVGERTFLTGWIYLGGFGWGSESLTDAFAGVGYDLNDQMSATLGYRYSAVDMRPGTTIYDISNKGPVFGLTVRF